MFWRQLSSFSGPSYKNKFDSVDSICDECVELKGVFAATLRVIGVGVGVPCIWACLSCPRSPAHHQKNGKMETHICKGETGRS